MSTTEEQVEVQQLHEEVRAIEYDKALKEVMKTEGGRLVVWTFLEKAKVFHRCFTGNSKTFYLLGRRELGLELFNEVMETCPELFWEAQQEQHRRELQDQLREEDGNA